MAPAGVPSQAPLREAIAQAEPLSHGHNDLQAAEILASVLAPLDPTSAGADVDLIDAAILYVTVAVPQRNPPVEPWATYAYRASRALHGDTHDRTLHATATLADHHDVHARWAQAAVLWQAVAHHRASQRGPGDPAALDATTSLVTSLHNLGACHDATATLRRARLRLSHEYGEDDPRCVRVGYFHVLLLRRCARTADAQAQWHRLQPLLPPARSRERAVLEFAMRVFYSGGIDHAQVCAYQRPDDVVLRHPAGGPPHTRLPASDNGPARRP